MAKAQTMLTLRCAYGNATHTTRIRDQSLDFPNCPNAPDNLKHV